MKILLRMWTPNKIGAFGSLGSSGSLGSTGSKGFKRYSWSADSTGSTRARNFWFLFSFRSQVVNFLKWKHHYLSENIAIFHSNDDLFPQYLFLNEKRCHLMTFSWRPESERMRARGKINHKFSGLLLDYIIITEVLTTAKQENECSRRYGTNINRSPLWPQ